MEDKVKVDSLSMGYIMKKLKEDYHSITEADVLNAIKEMLEDCDNELINLIAKYL